MTFNLLICLSLFSDLLEVIVDGVIALGVVVLIL